MARFSLLFKITFICLLLAGSVCSDDLFDSFQFTSDALSGFSPDVDSSTETAGSRTVKKENDTSFTPLNKKLQISNEIEKAVQNARAMDRHLRHGVREKYATLTRLFVKSVNSKSFSYARDVLGKLLYLLKTESPRPRPKRSTKHPGTEFTRRLREHLGIEKIDSFMAAKGEVSLMFVVDDTGSMGDEIQAVKRIAISVVKYKRRGPVEYILSPFNDPMEDAAKVVVRDDNSTGEFIQAINNLRAHSGGDCPEYAFQGMLNALGRGQEFSPMYVFTDAGPKDAENMDLVLSVAKDYGVNINIFSVGGGCASGLDSAFLETSKETSGKALLFRNAAELDKLATVIGETLKGTTTIGFGSSPSGRMKRSYESHGRYRFPVDDSMETIIIYVKTTLHTYGRGITLRDPAGTIVTAEKLTLSKVSVYHMTNPAKGNWTLEISGEETGPYEFSVESSSQINTDFNVYFLIALGRGRRKVEAPFSHPIAGKSNKMVLRLLASLESVNARSLQLQVTTETGDYIRTLDLRTNDNVHYLVNFTSPTTPFKLKLIGTTQRGLAFEREYHRVIKPTTAVLRGKHASNDFTLPLNKTSFLHFQICNFGPNERFEIVARNDTLGCILHPSAASQRPKFVRKDRCVTVYLRAKATRPKDVNKMDTVILKAKGLTTGVEISGTLRLLVDSRED